jgi:hypothetical protein
MVLDLATWKVANENLNRNYKISPFATKGQKKRQIPTHLLQIYRFLEDPKVIPPT